MHWSGKERGSWGSEGFFWAHSVTGKGRFLWQSLSIRDSTHSDKIFFFYVGFYVLPVRQYAHDQDDLITDTWRSISTAWQMTMKHFDKFGNKHVLSLTKTIILEMQSKQNHSWMDACKKNGDCAIILGFDRSHLRRFVGPGCWNIYIVFPPRIKASRCSTDLSQDSQDYSLLRSVCSNKCQKHFQSLPFPFPSGQQWKVEACSLTQPTSLRLG